MKTKNHDFINICGEWINLNEVRKIVVGYEMVEISFIDGTTYEIMPDEAGLEQVKVVLGKRLDKLM